MGYVGGVILCLGDSLGSGSRSESGKGWPEYLEDMLQDRFPKQTWICFNDSRAGDTSLEVRRRIHTSLTQVERAYEVCLLVGANDAKIKRPPSEYSKNITSIVRNCLIFGKHLYLMPPPLFRGFGAPDYDGRCNDLLSTYRQDFNATNVSWKNVTKVKCVDLIGKYVDGVHCCDQGYVEIAEAFLDAIEKRRSHKCQ